MGTQHERGGDITGFRGVPGIVELEARTGVVRLNRAALPRAAERIVFGRGLATSVVPEAVAGLAEAGRRGVLVVVGESSSRAPGIAALVDGMKSFGARVFVVRGHADHATIRAGIESVRRGRLGLVVAIGGGTVIDVAKSIAALAYQDQGSGGGASSVSGATSREDLDLLTSPGLRPADGHDKSEALVDIAAYQLGRRRLSSERTLPWVAVPTTSGTGSESTDNAVIELGEEKRSLRGIPSPRFIAADPALTDPLPLAPTIIAAVDAIAQALEVLASPAASEEVQQVALAAFVALARGMEDLYAVASHAVRETELDGTAPVTPDRHRTPAVSRAESPGSASRVDPATRDTLSWGSLLMGMAFANGRLGLPHGLVHFCNRFGLSHGNMVGILLVPGLRVQARDTETSTRLARAARALDQALQHKASEDRDAPAPEREGGSRAPRIAMPQSVPSGPEPLFRWLASRIPALFEAIGLPRTLIEAGLAGPDLDWIVARELENHPTFGTPARPATPAELRDVLEGACEEPGHRTLSRRV